MIRAGNGRIAHAARVEREMKFLLAYYEQESPTKGNLAASVVSVGYSKNNANFIGQRIIDRYSGRSFKESVDGMGMTKPYLAAKVREIIESDDSKPETKLMAIKMLLNNFGEKTDTGSQTVNINTPKALVVVGTSQKKIDAMLEPKRLEAQIVQPDVQP